MDSGHLDDRWALTLIELARRGRSGELVVRSAGCVFYIALERGRIVNASSPLAADRALRIAVLSRAITPQQAPMIAKWIEATPLRDELEVIVERGMLTPLAADTLRHQVIAHRAARTFALSGAWTFSPHRTLSVLAVDLDVRAIVFLGARSHLADEELRVPSGCYHLVDELRGFDFTPRELEIATELGTGASVAELEGRHRDVDSRTLQAIAFALTATGTVGRQRRPRESSSFAW